MKMDKDEARAYQARRRELLYLLYELFEAHQGEIKLRRQQEVDLLDEVGALYARRYKYRGKED